MRVNQTIFRIGKEIKPKMIPAGEGKSRMAVNVPLVENVRKKEKGEWVEYPTWVQASFYGEDAEFLVKFIKTRNDKDGKGLLIEVSGDVYTKTLKDESGAERPVLVMDVRDVDFARQAGTQTQGTEGGSNPAASKGSSASKPVASKTATAPKKEVEVELPDLDDLDGFEFDDDSLNQKVTDFFDEIDEEAM